MTKRILGILIISFVVATLAPVSAGSSELAAAAVVTTALLLAVAAQRALARRDQLAEWITIELNKLRRIYHLGKNLGGESRHRQWFTELHGHLYAYLTAFDKKSFSQYQETNGHFRKLSYHLYQIPSLDTEKERVLYRDLLEAAGTVAGARQRIQELWSGKLPSMLGNALVAMALLSSLAILMAMGPADRYAAAFTLATLCSAVCFVREADAMRDMGGEELSKRYVENIARLELSRHE